MESSTGTVVVSSSSEIEGVIQYSNKSKGGSELTFEWFVEHSAVCCICRKAIDSRDVKNVNVHSRLKVVICSLCFSHQDRNSTVSDCCWCGCCVTDQHNSSGSSSFETCCNTGCSNKLCSQCLASNFTNSQVKKMKIAWKCFDCEPQSIRPHQLYAECLLKFSRMFRKPLLSDRRSDSASAGDTRRDFVNDMKNLIVQLETTDSNENAFSPKKLNEHIELAQKLQKELAFKRSNGVKQEPELEAPETTPDIASRTTIPLGREDNVSNPVVQTKSEQPEPEGESILAEPSPDAEIVTVKTEPGETQPLPRNEIESAGVASNETVNPDSDVSHRQTVVVKSEDSDVSHLLSDVNRRYTNKVLEPTQVLPSTSGNRNLPARKKKNSEQPFLSSDDEADACSYSQEPSGPRDFGPLIVVSSEDELLACNSTDDDEEDSPASKKGYARDSQNGNVTGSISETSSAEDSDLPLRRRAIPAMPSTSSPIKRNKKPKTPSRASSATKRTFLSSDESSNDKRKPATDLESASSDDSTSKNTDSQHEAKAPSSKKRRRIYLVSDESDTDAALGENKDERSPKKFTKQNLQGNKAPASVEQETCIISSDDEDFIEPTPKIVVKTENSPQMGRKNIRELMSSAQLSKATVEANSREKERRKRLEDMQKKYNQFEKLNDEASETVKCVLEFDMTTKKPIVQVHEQLSAKMKSHQIQGVKFLYHNLVENVVKLHGNSPGSGAILGHCMGLGKTFQVVCFLHTLMTQASLREYFRTVLIVSPLNVIATWEEEIARWIDRDKKILDKLKHYSLHRESIPRLRLALLSKWQRIGGIMLMTPNLLTSLLGRETEAGKRKHVKSSTDAGFVDQFKKHICDPGPQILIVDEGHTLKKSTTQLTQVVLMIKTKRKILLTGTPLQNNLTEYFTMVSIVSPFLLGTKSEFRNRFENPIMNGQYKNSTTTDIRKMRQRASVLNKLLENVVHRRDLSVLQSILPPRHDYVLSMRLSPTQEVLYEKFLGLLLSKAEQQRQNANGPTFKRLLQDFVLLRSVWTHPKLLTMPKKTMQKKQAVATVSDMLTFDSITNDTATETFSKDWFKPFIDGKDLDDVTLGPKIFILFDIIQHCGMIGDKLVVFCTQLSALDLVETLLRIMNDRAIGDGQWVTNKDYFRMDGQTSAEDRHRYFKEFNDSANTRARLFLVSTNAGKLGSTLTGANRMVLLDTSWNPADDNQAVYRIYRIGQRKPVFIYRFVSFGTMEEKIYARNILKESTSCRVLDDSNMERHFTHEDVRDLYTFTPYVDSDRRMPSVPKDIMLAELILRHKDIIVKVHEHQQMLQNLEDDLSEEDRKIAWEEYQREKEEIPPTPALPAINLAPTLGNNLDNFIFQFKKIKEFEDYWARTDITDKDRLRCAAAFRNLARKCCEQILGFKEQRHRQLADALRRQIHTPQIMAEFVGQMRQYDDTVASLTRTISQIEQLIDRSGRTPIPRNR